MSTVTELNTGVSYFQELGVDTIMDHEVLTVYEGWSLSCLTQFFVEHSLSAAPVVAADGELVGEVSLSDVAAFQARKLSEEDSQKMLQRHPETAGVTSRELQALHKSLNDYSTVNEIMRKNVAAVDVSTMASDACRMILEQNMSYLYVTEQGLFVGAVKAMDFLRLSLK